jgi:hypothetical protein
VRRYVAGVAIAGRRLHRGMMTGGTRPITASYSALGLGDVPATMNASSASDVTLAAMYQRKWCGDMQAPPFARIEKAQEAIARIVSAAIAAEDPSRSACRRGALRRPDQGADSARLRIPRSGAAPLLSLPARRPAPSRVRPCVESRRCSAGALSQTEHRDVIQRNDEGARSDKRMPA